MGFGLIISNLKRISRLFRAKGDLPQWDENTAKWNESHEDLNFANIYKVVNRFHSLLLGFKNPEDKNKVAEQFYHFMRSKNGCSYELPYPDHFTNAQKTAHLGIFASPEERIISQICDLANCMEGDKGLEILTPHIKSSMPHSSHVDIEVIMNRQKQDLIKSKCSKILARFLIVQQYGEGAPIAPRIPSPLLAESPLTVHHHL
jgi:hypothetical protein